MSFKSISPKIIATVLMLTLALLVIRAVASHYKRADLPAPSRAELEQAARAEVARNQEAGRRAKEEEAAKRKADSAKPSVIRLKRTLGEL